MYRGLIVYKPLIVRLQLCFIVFNLQPGTSKAESSAYSSSLHFTAADISFMSINNNWGPRIEPWGTPHVIFFGTQRVPSTSHTWVLSGYFLDCSVFHSTPPSWACQWTTLGVQATPMHSNPDTSSSTFFFFGLCEDVSSHLYSIWNTLSDGFSCPYPASLKYGGTR